MWVGITGYGRGEPGASRVAFGDDAAAAAGLATALARQAGTPVFCGDAIADPLAALHAAVAALAMWRRGHGALIDVALRDVAAYAAKGLESPSARTRVVERSNSIDPHRDDLRFELVDGTARAAVAPPRARPVDAHAAPMGEHTAQVLAELRASQC